MTSIDFLWGWMHLGELRELISLCKLAIEVLKLAERLPKDCLSVSWTADIDDTVEFSETSEEDKLEASLDNEPTRDETSL